ncbi:D-ribose pyranase [Crenobacter caeni]|uniref:D-ribose pyranase n=1 Tax=Crenobacter caeni TaxID=2705474 RepID=A0A6B2KMX2_9NEIS|nr:D-ribose pyranase [Crenobacter caeni]NDV11582.1 D-ribose pyranase [Crenobacter caeni]
MKKTGTLNAQLARVLAELGHGDSIVIADCGLPIPPGVERIDLALTPGIPSFVDTLQVVLSEMQVEHAVMAEEVRRFNPRATQCAVELQEAGIGVRLISHTDFKALSKGARAVIRTGEATPYANVILFSGVVF